MPCTRLSFSKLFAKVFSTFDKSFDIISNLLTNSKLPLYVPMPAIAPSNTESAPSRPITLNHEKISFLMSFILSYSESAREAYLLPSWPSVKKRTYKLLMRVESTNFISSPKGSVKSVPPPAWQCSSRNLNYSSRSLALVLTNELLKSI